MKRLLATLAVLLLSAFAAFAQDAADESESETGLALPRFVVLRFGHVNARSGPGTRYPIEWVYRQQYAPAEIIAEFEDWRKIKDWQGSESWVHKTNVAGKRYVKIITPGENNIYAKDDYKSKVIARVEDEAIGEIKKCPVKTSFCLIKFGNITGWLPRQNLYGIYPDEIID